MRAMWPSTSMDFSCVTAKCGLAQRTGTPAFQKARESLVVRAAAGGTLRIQHHAHGDASPGALDHGLLNLRLREGELLDDERVAGTRDEIDDGADAVVRLHDEVTGFRHAGQTCSHIHHSKLLTTPHRGIRACRSIRRPLETQTRADLNPDHASPACFRPFSPFAARWISASATRARCGSRHVDRKPRAAHRPDSPHQRIGSDHSPYNILSSMALEPATIATVPEELHDLSRSDFERITPRNSISTRCGPAPVRYGEVKKLKRALLGAAHENFREQADEGRMALFDDFCRQHDDWLPPYALYRALVSLHGRERGLRPLAREQRTLESAQAWLETLSEPSEIGSSTS